MARKRSCGFLETLFKSVLGVGTTVHYKTDSPGRRQKVVRHHDSSKTKTYTHSDGFLFGGTTTRTTQNGREIERGRVRRGLFWGATEKATRSVRLPRFFVCQRVEFMLPVFPGAAL